MHIKADNWNVYRRGSFDQKKTICWQLVDLNYGMNYNDQYNK